MPFYLPLNAFDISYRDEVGNISTSRCRPEGDRLLLELAPRFPLYGGWKSYFEVRYRVPTEENVQATPDGTKKISISLAPFSLESHIKNYKLQVVFPEGAKY